MDELERGVEQFPAGQEISCEEIDPEVLSVNSGNCYCFLFSSTLLYIP